MRHPKEFYYAQQYINNMRSAETLAVYEMHWKDFLSNLDRGWEKAKLLANASSSAKQSVISNVNNLRKTDALLQYLQQARHCNEHTVREIVKQAGGGTILKAGPGGARILPGTIIGGSREHAPKFEGNLQVTFDPKRLVAIDVQNRGVTYCVPTWHNSQPITTNIPHELAQLGLDFYMQALNNLNL